MEEGVSTSGMKAESGRAKEKERSDLACVTPRRTRSDRFSREIAIERQNQTFHYARRFKIQERGWGTKCRRLDSLDRVPSIAVPLERPLLPLRGRAMKRPEEPAGRIVRLILGAAAAMVALQIVGGLLKHAS